MSTQEKHFEQITAYLKNEMTLEEVKSFEKELSENEDLQKEFSFHVNLQETWKDNTNVELKNQFKTLEQSLPSVELPKSTSKNKLVSLFPKLAVAASILLLAGFFFLNSANNSSDLYESHFSDYPNELVKIERGDSEELIGQQAFVLYGDKKYDQALQAFEKLEIEGLDVYKAICLMHNSDYNKALELLERKSKGSVDHTNQRAWYAALCHIKLDDSQKAKLYLQIILDSSSSFRKSSAQKLLKEIN